MLQIFDTLARFVARGYKSLNFLQYAQIGLEVIDRGQRTCPEMILFSVSIAYSTVSTALITLATLLSLSTKGNAG